MSDPGPHPALVVVRWNLGCFPAPMSGEVKSPAPHPELYLSLGALKEAQVDLPWHGAGLRIPLPVINNDEPWGTSA